MSDSNQTLTTATTAETNSQLLSDLLTKAETNVEQLHELIGKVESALENATSLQGQFVALCSEAKEQPATPVQVPSTPPWVASR